LQCVALCCKLLQGVIVCCSAFQLDDEVQSSNEYENNAFHAVKMR